MKDHAEIHKLLSAYCGGELEPGQKARVEEHLASCPACRTDLADLETALRLIRSTPEVEPPPWLTARIMARLREETAPRRRWYEWLFLPLHIKLPLEIMALLIVSVSGYYLARNIESEMNAPAVQQEMPAAPAPAPAKEAAKPAGQEPAPAAPSLRAPQSKKLEHPAARQTEPPAPPPAAPKALEQQAPPPSPAASDKATAPPAYAPAPPDIRGKRDESTYGTGIESREVEQKREQGYRDQGAAPAMNKAAKKAKKSAGFTEQALKSEEVPAGSMTAAKQALPRLKLRLAISDLSSASEAVRQAVTRSGGEVVREAAERQVMVRIGKDKLPELLERLGRIGRIVERPSLTDATGMLEIDITW